MYTEEDFEIIETEKRLSECILWRLQEEYYSGSGQSAWSDVPFYVTCNQFIAEAYADLIIAFILDYKPYLNWEEPLYVLEMATGTGYFSMFLLKELMVKKEYFPELDPLKVVYVMTDFADSNVYTWGSNEALRPYMEHDVVDFAVFRPDIQEQLTLVRSGKQLTPGSLANPVIAIANYFFDSIRMDLFRIESGQLKEVRWNFFRERKDITPNGEVTLEQLRRLESYHDITSDYYPDPRLNEILSQYQDAFVDASIIFPLATFQCLANLQNLSGNKLVLLSADKGFTGLDYMGTLGEYNYTTHGGAFSFMVNYDAIGRYFENQRGEFLCTTGKSQVLVCAMGVLIDKPDFKLDYSRYFFNDHVRKKDPVSNLFLCCNLIYQDSYENPRIMVRSFIAFLQLCNFDAYVMYLCISNLYRSIGKIESYTEEVVLDFLANIKDINEEIYGTALYTVALCFEEDAKFEVALDLFRQALELVPDSPFVQQSVQRVEALLAGEDISPFI